MMSEDNQCSLDGLDEENKLIIDCLPAEVLAICLSYTGRDLPNARLTCRRFNQIIEDYEYMMNVIPVDTLFIENYQCQDLLSIEQMTWLRKSARSYRTTCKLDQVMHYVRFLRPKCMYFGEHLEATDMKKYLTYSWRKSIAAIEICRKMCDEIFSIFPNVNTLNYNPYNRNGSVMAEMASIFANPPQSIRRLRLKGDCEEDDSSLDFLMQMQISNEFFRRIESLKIDPPSSFSIESTIRLIENVKFGEKFELSLTVDDFGYYPQYSDGESDDDGYFFEPDWAYDIFQEWIHLH